MILLGKKVKMSQVWKDEKVIPVTVIHAAPNTVGLVRTKEKDKYEAIQLALGRERREFRVKRAVTAEGIEKGATLDVSAFAEGDVVNATGVSKGHGFQGVVKRHGFHGGPKTHGQKNRHRAPGSLGSTAPQRVVPGRKMAGRMGNDNVTLKNLNVVAVNKDNNTILLEGAVPGAKGGLIKIVKVRSKAK